MFNNAKDLEGTVQKYISEHDELKKQVEAYMNGEESDILVYDIASKTKLATIKTGQQILNEIYLSDNGRLISVAYEKEVKFWSVK